MRPQPPKRPDTDPRDAALRLLARREHSRAELLSKLAARGFENAEAAAALDALQTEGLLSDTRFTEVYVRSRAERGFGPLKIGAELRQRGIADELIEQCLESPPALWLESARVQHRKRFGTQPARSFREKARRARFLQSRGFSSDVIGKVLDDT